MNIFYSTLKYYVNILVITVNVLGDRSTLMCNF